jgi:hypothetical protein
VVDNAATAEAAAQAVHRRQRLLRRFGDIDGLRWIEAQVALPAGGNAGLAEIAPDRGGPAAGAVEHGVELAHLAHLHGLDRLIDIAAVDAAQHPGEIGGGIERDALGEGAVAPGAADLLPVGLDGVRRIGMDDIAHVRLVDAHAEGDGRHHHGGVGLEELLQAPGAQVFVEPGMIGERRHAGRRQRRCQLVDALARAGIDHARAARALGHQLQDPAVPLSQLALGRERELRARKAVDELARVGEPELGADVRPRARVRCRGDGQARDMRKDLRQPAEHAVLGPEVVAPLADAVRLVDGHQRQRQLRQALQHGRLHQAFGRQVEQVQRAFAGAAPHVAAGVRGGAGIELLGSHTRLLQCRHLVGHQRNQRRDDEAETGADQRGDLVAQALAAARRQHGERATPGQDLADHAGLQPAEVA